MNNTIRHTAHVPATYHNPQTPSSALPIRCVSNTPDAQGPQTHPDPLPSPTMHQPSQKKHLRQMLTQRLASLSRPKEGWFFEKTMGALDLLTHKDLKGIHEILDHTKHVKNILSFGARDGGFELAMQVRHDFDKMNEQKTMPFHNYLDAISLQNHRHTVLQKLEGLDVFKMQNPFWDIGYKHGIDNAAKMVFFITPEWLGSPFCKQEFDWLKQSKNNNIDTALLLHMIPPILTPPCMTSNSMPLKRML